ncbi:MAG: glycosyltransferase [Planctomycetota bacterium]|nr:glycosyltransferase [Planctomycetota bacterium]
MPEPSSHRASSAAASAGRGRASGPRAPRLLLLSHRVPYPPDRGDRIRAFHLLEFLSRSFDIAVACTSDEVVRLAQRQHLQQYARRVSIDAIDPTYSKARALVMAAAAGSALTPAYFFRRRLAHTILRWHAQDPFDAVLTICTSMIGYARLLVPAATSTQTPASLAPEAASSAPSPDVVSAEAPGPPPAAGRSHASPRHVLDLVDVDSLKWETYAATGSPPMSWIYALEARRLSPIEAGRQDRLDAVTLVSAAEAEVYRQRAPEARPPVVVSNGVDLAYFAPTPDPMTRTIAFVGVLDYAPNVEGIVWFVREVMPLLKPVIPDVRLLVIGKHPTPAVQMLGREPGVEVVGAVPDVRVYLARSAAVIAPLRMARGVQNKVLEGMAAGRTVVCSGPAAKGIDAQPGRDLLVADTPQEWVDTLSRVLREPEFRRSIAQAARRRVEERYAWATCLEPMARLLRGEAVRSGHDPSGEA